MKISVIIPLYYGKKYIRQLKGMIKRNRNNVQEYSEKIEIETIMINDSPEEEINISMGEILFYQNDKNIGIHATRVRGADLASGDYILFLDQDDEIADDYLVSQISHIKDSDAVLCNGYYKVHELIFKNGQMPLMEWENYFKIINPIISPGQVLIKKTSIPRNWKENILCQSGVDDYFLWILMVAEDRKFQVNQDVLYTHVEHASNASADWEKMKLSLQEMLNYIVAIDMDREKKQILIPTLNDFIVKYERLISIDSMIANMKAKKIHKYFENNKINKVALYGYGAFGQKLAMVLLDENISISYIMDKNRFADENELCFIAPEEECEKVDLMIITPINYYHEIEALLRAKNIGRIIFLEDFLREVVFD